ncbi:MAG: prepilin peptidase [Proteobacteria bacterium]|nr:MAG: prepilin peptidase [Pseudomonadota bacterium]
MVTTFAILLGLIIGSFLTVCIYRLPYGREMGPPNWSGDEQVEAEKQKLAEHQGDTNRELTLTTPARSICPGCNKQLLWWHNIPLFSWLLLRGRCHFCKVSISARYPVVELLTAVSAWGSVNNFGISPTALVVFAFCCALIVISFIDYDYYIIPDVISLPGTLLGLLVGLLNHFTGIFAWPVAPGIWSSLLGVAFGGGLLFLISEAYFRLRKREGLGMGDVKLLAMTGAFFGIPAAFFTMFVGSLLGSVLGLFFIVFFRRRMTHELPFGPYLAVGTIIYLFFGQEIGYWRI